jgi:hypothetical protein
MVVSLQQRGTSPTAPERPESGARGPGRWSKSRRRRSSLRTSVGVPIRLARDDCELASVYSRCSTRRHTKQLRTVGIRGSRSSASLIFCRNRRVAPRMYSLGCCCSTRHCSAQLIPQSRASRAALTRSFRIALLEGQ